MRRTPSQTRSAARVEQMLTATAELLDEHGYERVTTTLIADRAGVSVGSLYQFFVDKRAIVAAVYRRNGEEYFRRLSQRLQDPPDRPWQDIVDETIDVYRECAAQMPGFRGLTAVPEPHLLDESLDNDEILAQWLAAVVAKKFGTETTPELQRALMVIIATGRGLFELAFRLEPQQGDEFVLAEAARIGRWYLEQHLPSTTPGREEPSHSDEPRR